MKNTCTFTYPDTAKTPCSGPQIPILRRTQAHSSRISRCKEVLLNPGSLIPTLRITLVQFSRLCELWFTSPDSVKNPGWSFITTLKNPGSLIPFLRRTLAHPFWRCEKRGLTFPQCCEAPGFTLPNAAKKNPDSLFPTLRTKSRALLSRRCEESGLTCPDAAKKCPGSLIPALQRTAFIVV